MRRRLRRGLRAPGGIARSAAVATKKSSMANELLRAGVFVLALGLANAVAAVVVVARSAPPLPTRVTARELTLRLHPRDSTLAFDGDVASAWSGLPGGSAAQRDSALTLALPARCSGKIVRLVPALVRATRPGGSVGARVSIATAEDCMAELFVTHAGSTMEPMREPPVSVGPQGVSLTFAETTRMFTDLRLPALEGKLVSAERTDQQPTVFSGYEQADEYFLLESESLWVSGIDVVVESGQAVLQARLSDARGGALTSAQIGRHPALSAWNDARWIGVFGQWMTVSLALLGGTLGYLSYRKNP